MKLRMRRGFTLVELLVVITIIGMLMALLLPAVQSAREAGRRATCMNNQKNVALAMLSYESSKGSFPGFYNEIGKNKDDPGIIYHAGWVVPLLPFLERADLYEVWADGSGTHLSVDPAATDAKPRGYVNIPILACPSDIASATSDDNPPCSFRVNGGRRGISSTPFRDDVYQDYNYLGVFDMVLPSANAGTTNRWKNTSLSSGGIRDGASNTFMLSENVRENDPWTTGWTAGAGAAPDFNPGHYGTDFLGNGDALLEHAGAGSSDAKDLELAFAFFVPQQPLAEGSSGGEDVGGEFRINENRNGRSNGNARGGSPASFHPGGATFAFCDGHVRFINEQINDNTYLHLITPNSKKAQQWGEANEVFYFYKQTDGSSDPPMFYGVLDEQDL